MLYSHCVLTEVFTLRIVNSMTTGHVLLGLLAQGDRHGYDLKREHDERFPAARPLAFGQVYAALDRLTKQGKVTPVEVERVDGPDRTVFSLTGKGRASLDEWLAEVEPAAPFVANPLAIKASIALIASDEATASGYLQRQRAAHLARMRELTALKTDPGTSILDVLSADYAIAHLDADLRWLDTALNRFTQLSQAISATPPQEETP